MTATDEQYWKHTLSLGRSSRLMGGKRLQSKICNRHDGASKTKRKVRVGRTWEGFQSNTLLFARSQLSMVNLWQEEVESGILHYLDRPCQEVESRTNHWRPWRTAASNDRGQWCLTSLQDPAALNSFSTEPITQEPVKHSIVSRSRLKWQRVLDG